MRGSIGAFACALIAVVNAAEYYPQLPNLRRDAISFPNGTYTNTSTTATTSSNIISPSVKSKTKTKTKSENSTSTDTYTSPSLVDSPFSNTTASTTDSCLGSVTYFNSVPPTVYATVTEGFDVTVTASNASLPPAQTITPPVACVATIIPDAETQGVSSSSKPCVAGVCFPVASSTSSALVFQPALTIITLSASPAAASALGTVKTSSNRLGPDLASTAGVPVQESSASLVASTGSAFTSTVLVTKKTPVPIVVSSTSANPPVFQIPATTKATTSKPATTAGNVAGGSTVPGSSANGGGGGSSNSPNPSPAPAPAQSQKTTPVGSIIASAINQPFTPAAAPAPETTSIDNVPIQILPSGTAVIGGQVVSIPSASSQTTLNVNGQIFTVGASQIIAPGTTYALTPQRNQVGAATPTPTPVTAGGITFSVGVSQAIVSGTTYAIGIGASPATALVGSKTIIFGTGGVGVGGTTVAPEIIATEAPEIITAGGLTLTVGPSAVAVGGTTYAIGAGASETTVVVNGQTLSIGSKGVGLASTTIAPEPIFTVVSAGGLTFSVDSSEAILSGTTYSIGKGAHKTTKVIGGTETVTFGPSGVGVASTTIPPESTNAFSAGAGQLAAAPLAGFLGALGVMLI